MKRRALTEWTAERRRGLILAGLVGLALLAGAIYLLWVLGGFEQLRMLAGGLRAVGERLRALVEESGPWAPLVYVAAKAFAFAVVPLASPPLNVASGALFGLFWGVVLTAVGDTLAGCALYGLARVLGRGAVARFVGERVAQRLDRVLDRGLGGWPELLFVRLVLPVPYNLVSLAAGLARRLPFRHYLVVTFLTASIPNVFEVGIGAGLVAGQWTQVALAVGLVVVGVAALLTRRSIRNALVRALRSKLGTGERSRDREGAHGKDRGRGRGQGGEVDRPADARPGEDDPS
jgi:uncharacterized membrane protein YdjX (TVP38/TMEM64 family)